MGVSGRDMTREDVLAILRTRVAGVSIREAARLHMVNKETVQRYASDLVVELLREAFGNSLPRALQKRTPETDSRRHDSRSGVRTAAGSVSA